MVDSEDELLMILLLETSSSSDDEELEILKEMNTEKPKIKHFIESVVHKFSDLEFKQNFRMNRDTCYKIINSFQNSIFCPSDNSHGGSKKISAENHILCFLWFAGNKCCLRDVAQRFGVGQTSAFRIIERVLNYFDEIAGDIIVFPNTEQERAALSAEFFKVSQFPNVIGCIDGTSINIRTPVQKVKSTYVNRHDIPSVTLQAICDHKRRFLDVFTGAPGKIHDSRVYRLSFISKELPQICNYNYHLLGDGAYSIREWLLTPYRDYGNLTPQEVNYNKRFSATRVLIENAFGILKGRLRQLQRLDLHKINKITKFIIASCVIHNFCIDNDDYIEENLDAVEGNEDMQNDTLENERDVILKQLGENKREIIRNLLNA